MIFDIKAISEKTKSTDAVIKILPTFESPDKIDLQALEGLNRPVHMNQNRADATDETDESPKESSFVSFGSNRQACILKVTLRECSANVLSQ